MHNWGILADPTKHSKADNTNLAKEWQFPCSVFRFSAWIFYTFAPYQMVLVQHYTRSSTPNRHSLLTCYTSAIIRHYGKNGVNYNLYKRMTSKRTVTLDLYLPKTALYVERQLGGFTQNAFDASIRVGHSLRGLTCYSAWLVSVAALFTEEAGLLGSRGGSGDIRFAHRFATLTK